ncbi:hypothetical protein HKX48_005036 [Thoreauomyces humboldtii]|nr:hypothetical protein HKX48_005036 [Thoreauomyces humboldtii]
MRGRSSLTQCATLEPSLTEALRKQPMSSTLAAANNFAERTRVALEQTQSRLASSQLECRRLRQENAARCKTLAKGIVAHAARMRVLADTIIKEALAAEGAAKEETAAVRSELETATKEVTRLTKALRKQPMSSTLAAANNLAEPVRRQLATATKEVTRLTEAHRKQPMSSTLAAANNFAERTRVALEQTQSRLATSQLECRRFARAARMRVLADTIVKEALAAGSQYEEAANEETTAVRSELEAATKEVTCLTKALRKQPMYSNLAPANNWAERTHVALKETESRLAASQLECQRLRQEKNELRASKIAAVKAARR